jgi:hypothetical protein
MVTVAYCADSFTCRIQKVAMAHLSTISGSVKGQKSHNLGKSVQETLFSLELMLWKIQGKVSLHL